MRNDAAWGDVVINEVMCDPAPAVLLPECEYLELFNRSDHTVELEGWRLEIGRRGYGIGNMRLGPREYGLLHEPGYADQQVLNGVPLFSSGASLPNGGAIIALYDSHDSLIHVVTYADPGTGPEWKRDGGWSLEAADPDRPCHTSRLWEYSEDKRGGTPGEKNSVHHPGTDLEPPRFMYMGYPGPKSITLHFSELVRIDPVRMKKAYISPGGIHPDSISMGRPYFDHLTLHFPGELPPGVEAYLLVPEVSDCSGNCSIVQKIPVGQVSEPRFSSVQVNEVMYDPEDGFPEFIELHNPGNEFFDLGKLLLDVEGAGDFMTNPVPISEGSRILSPGDLVVLSEHNQSLMKCYGLEDTGQWVELEDMPSLPNSGGTIYMADRSGNVIEMVHYHDGMHMALLDDTRGVSLERISPERRGTDPASWHSAASIAGYSTPGRKNSQSLPERGGGGELVLEPKVFSPDQDGFEDILRISFFVEGRGWVVRLWVTDLKGNLVRQLADNHVSGPASVYTWDGEGEDGRMVKEGIYVVHLRGYHESSGERFNRKSATGIIYR